MEQLVLQLLIQQDGLPCLCFVKGLVWSSGRLQGIRGVAEFRVPSYDFKGLVSGWGSWRGPTGSYYLLCSYKYVKLLVIQYAYLSMASVSKFKSFAHSVYDGETNENNQKCI